MPSRETLFFIYNPQSSRGEKVRDILDLKRALGGRYPWAETKAPLEAAQIAANVARDGVQTIVAVGGDGTVHEIVNGIMSLPKETRPKLGILPVGSGNDFALAAGIRNNLSQALDVVLRGDSMPADIGSLEDDRGQQIFWDNSVGIGFDAKVSIRSKRFQALHGLPLYLASALLTLLRDHELLEIDMTIDMRRFSERLLMLTLGNGPREGGGFYTTPNSKIDDGKFEMLLVKPLSRLSMLALLPKVLRGTHLTSNAVFERPFSSLRLVSHQPLAIHADGEIFARPRDGVRGITVQLHRSAIRVIV